MLKKYGVITLLLLGLCGVRSVLASCSFTTPAEQYIDQTMASSPITAVTLSGKGLALSTQQLFQSSVLSGGPVISTCNPTTGGAISVSGDNFSSAPLSETMPDGGLLMFSGSYVFGYGFWYTVTYGDGSGSASGHLKEGAMFNATPAQLNNAKWEFQAELWYAGGSYADRQKVSQVNAINTTYFKIGFAGIMKGFYFYSPAIPITPTTCNLSIDRTSVDFGAFNFLQYGGGGTKNGPTQSISVRNSNCTMLTKIEYLILSNGNSVSSDKHLLLNKLTGDDAASGFGVAFYSNVYTNSWSDVPYIIDALPGTNVSSTQFNTMDPDTGMSVLLYLEPDGTPLRNGKFEATATINVNYY
ncbi:fimbrial protein [Citrobacter sp. Igbk 16]|uniref:fimbrial protein n=1 Tax=Citrobacter sp. Igbk 16 TaxID=2963958 RepID=UPI002303FD6F|nr:fimbrial protein [Citrobacter sp. Igbk 16]MDA8516902.1 fimbrial protein [Citrobacter sp. Igbk 16]